MIKMEWVQSLVFYSPVSGKEKNPAAQWERQHSFQSSKISILRKKKKKKEGITCRKDIYRHLETLWILDFSLWMTELLVMKSFVCERGWILKQSAHAFKMLKLKLINLSSRMCLSISALNVTYSYALVLKHAHQPYALISTPWTQLPEIYRQNLCNIIVKRTCHHPFQECLQ